MRLLERRPQASVKRRRRTTKPLDLVAAPVSILVASTLIINAVEPCQAAPQPIPAINIRQRRRESPSSRLRYSDIDDHLPRSIHSDDSAANMIFEVPSKTAPLFPRDLHSDPLHLHRRAYEVTTASGKTIVVPSALVSSIASSWDPRQRSVWFQRKAVIITSVFLAILIVLIIGAAAFIRDKREEDAEEEVDVSDETALKRMREEREMRKGGGKGRKKKGKGDTEKDREGGFSSSIVTRWARVPTRRLKKNKTRSTISSKSATSRPASITEDTRPSDRPSQEINTQEAGQTSSQEMHTSFSASSGLHRSSSESARDAQARSSNHRDTLSVADVTAADAEVERHLDSGSVLENSEAFPPAYIDSNARGSNAPAQLHPSANRQLAGSSSTHSASNFNDEKQAPPTSYEATTASSNGGSSALPAVQESASPGSSEEDQYAAHIATDDKTALGRLQDAASAPLPSMPISTAPPISSLSAQQASAPAIEEDADDDLTESELQQIQANTASDQKGKATAERPSSLLPAPPSALTPSAFNRFDMPYAMERVASSPSRDQPTQKQADTSAKAQEAEEEKRQAFALVASKPEDMADLPRYEGRDALASAPSAPLDEDDKEEEAAPPSPSAPPL